MPKIEKRQKVKENKEKLEITEEMKKTWIIETEKFVERLSKIIKSYDVLHHSIKE